VSQELHTHDNEMPTVPRDGTAAARTYFRAAASDLGLFHFLIDVVLRGDYNAFVANLALEGSDEYKTTDPSQLAKTDPGPMTKFLRKNRQALLEMFLARLVDNFQIYLVDLIRVVLHAKPAMLSTRQQTLTLEELLRYDRIEDLIHDIIEKRINALAYEGFGDLQAWCGERGIEIHVPKGHRDAVVELIATRNVIAHNRGLVDDKYVRAIRMSRFNSGEVRRLDVDDLFGALALLHRVVGETDRLAVEKFQLSTVPMNPEAGTATPVSTSDKPGGKEGEASGPPA